MKLALENYYLRLDKLYFKEYGTHPTVSYIPELCDEMLISDVDDDGEIQWKMVPIEPFDVDKIFSCIGVRPSDELSELYSSYYFAQLCGKIGNTIYYFDANALYKNRIDDLILLQYNNAKHYFPNKEYFLVGTASVDGADDYLLFYDNKEKMVHLYDGDSGCLKNNIGNIKYIINNMEACE